MQEYKEEVQKFDELIKEKYGEFDSKAITVFDLDDMEDPITNGDDDDEDESEAGGEDKDKDDPVHGPFEFQNVEITLPHGDRHEMTKVLEHKRNTDGSYSRRKHGHLMLDSRIFMARFPDGDEKDVAYNVIGEHLYSQVGEEGNQYQLFRAIVAHRRTKAAIDKADQH
uniref:Uncharacterized protein n=1 Tax=Corethron hystrix TaxID=216773 RepID=A0A6U5JYV1_9STRA|mmetsp:Transcript_38882/g.90459  ORF Transcript_38882/g.90459 Transcript_38882/m.90459 type:complete len:168 (+) Transcript_38882:1155-1658(+)